MIVEVDKMSAPSPRERAQYLYEKNIELENKRQRSAQARVPSDPNAWQQMRENYESIILEDHTFSEQHNIEYALWQLHYKRIEELRSHFSAALASMGSNPSQGVKGPSRPDRLTKIRLQFKTFLSEATGFYHDLIMKIRAKYGLPLGYFSEDSENQIVMEKDNKKSADMKKGLISCHRCLIYLGDLARYKGLYGEGDSKSRAFAAASSYYLQAASLWPSNGNPHHQLAILASYSGDELVAVYRYFRSLAVESPFTTARDNLIVSFEKNRQSYSQLPGDVKAPTVKETPVRVNGKGRGKAQKDTGVEVSLKKERASTTLDVYKTFCTRFVRLNGILFTRTSLETFSEVLSLVSSGFLELLSSGPDEELNFGKSAVDNGLAIIRIISILIFIVHNVNREAEGQTYVEIVQRRVLLQNAFAAVFELMSHIVERCAQLRDPSSSFLLPGVLVFVEWLACCPDVATGKDVDENPTGMRSKFWSCCISFFNKLLSSGQVCIDDDGDDTCFRNTSRYEEGETENRLALWEDFELRGFLPLLPAQMILDFSRKHTFGGDSDKEQKARVKRILAAGKALANIVRIDHETIYFDSKVKKFMIGVEPQTIDAFDFTSTQGVPTTDGMKQENSAETTKLGIIQSNPHQYIEGEEEDEVIVFKPIVAEKRTDAEQGSKPVTYQGLEACPNAPGDLHFLGNLNSVHLNNLQQTTFSANSHMPVSVPSIMPYPLQSVQAPVSRWVEEEALVNSVQGIALMDSGHMMKRVQQVTKTLFNPTALSVPVQKSYSTNNAGMFYSLSKAPEASFPSKNDALPSGVLADNMVLNASLALPSGLRKAPVSRPARHIGPPPGFNPVPSKQGSDHSGSDMMSGNPILDDYSWLDGYQLSSTTNGLGNTGPITYTNSQFVNHSDSLTGTVSFPFPGKQVPSVSVQMEKQNGWQDHQAYGYLKGHHEHQLQQQPPLSAGNQQFNTLPERFQGQSIWTG